MTDHRPPVPQFRCRSCGEAFSRDWMHYPGECPYCCRTDLEPAGDAAAPSPGPGAFTISLCWGWFDPSGQWHHNPALVMTEAEQLRENVAAGHVCGDCRRSMVACLCAVPAGGGA